MRILIGTPLALRVINQIALEGPVMWNWLNCYLSGRHDYGVSCHSGEIFLRCIHCGKRSSGWEIHGPHLGVHPASLAAGAAGAAGRASERADACRTTPRAARVVSFPSPQSLQ